MSKGAGRILISDSEWGYTGSRLGRSTAFEPIVFCFKDATSGQRYTFWGRDDGLASFIEANSEAVFVAFYAVAEMSYMLRWNIELPARWVDLFIDFRLLTNEPNLGNDTIPAQKASQLSALDYFKIPHIETARKDEMREKCLHLSFDEADKPEIQEYCESDVDGAELIWRAMGSRIPQEWELNAEFCKEISKMELRGIPFDIKTFELIIRSRVSLRREFIEDVNEVARVFRKDGSFNNRAILGWAHDEGIRWPLQWSDSNLDYYRAMDDETFKTLASRHPFFELLRQTIKTIDSLSLRSIPVDGLSHRHYFSTSIFRTITGRNAPKNFVYSTSKWMRHLIVPPTKNHVLISVDCKTQEVGIAAALSQDPGLRRIYFEHDAHMAFAEMAGAIPKWATEEELKLIRKKYKNVSIGSLYGLTEWGISKKLGISRSEARAMLRQHKKLFSGFWRWSEGTVLAARTHGEIWTRLGWRCLVTPDSNSRTWMNWKIQSTGSDLMRLIVCYFGIRNIELLAPIHDGFLVSCKRSEVDLCKKAIQLACDDATDQILPGFPLIWEAKVFEHRYEEEDETAQKMWVKVRERLIAWFPNETAHLR